jgi:mannitol/fructose-specific phosphotransferase system IIA component
MIAFLGSFIPFVKTKAERIRTKDPRLSIEERYANRQEYLEKISAAAKSLAASGYVLESDVSALIERARTQWDYLTK